jgi:predicted O-methyltransferase YrrM
MKPLKEELLIINRQEEQSIFLYEYVKKIKPNKIIELGVGSGGYTVAMGIGLKELNQQGKIYSYDIQSPLQLKQIHWMKNWKLRGVINELEDRELSDMWTFTEGDCHETFVKNPIPFDLLLIDADQDWNGIYKIVIENKFINNQIKSGAKVIIEGGAKNHPRISEKTFKDFNKQFNTPPFNYECVAVGYDKTKSRTWDNMSSISILKLN